jgi:hypothetical protein
MLRSFIQGFFKDFKSPIELQGIELKSYDKVFRKKL